MKSLFELFITTDIVKFLTVTVIPIICLILIDEFFSTAFYNRFSIFFVNILRLLVKLFASAMVPTLIVYFLLIFIKTELVQNNKIVLNILISHGFKIYFMIFLLIPIGFIVSIIDFKKKLKKDNKEYELYLEENL